MNWRDKQRRQKRKNETAAFHVRRLAARAMNQPAHRGTVQRMVIEFGRLQTELRISLFESILFERSEIADNAAH